MTNNQVKPRVLAIGDIFTDAFIKLRDDSARIDVDEDGEAALVQFPWRKART